MPNPEAGFDLLSFTQKVDNELLESSIIFKETGTYPLLVGNGAWRVPDSELFVIGSFKTPINNKRPGVVVLNMDGEIVHGEFNHGLLEVVPIYTSIFKSRTDVNACVHTHATYLTAYSVAEQPLKNHHISLPRFGIRDEIPVAPYSTRYDGSTIESLLQSKPDIPGLLHANHGSFIFGSSILDASRRTVFFEEGAKILLLAEQIGGAKALPENAYEEIQAGLKGEIPIRRVQLA